MKVFLCFEHAGSQRDTLFVILIFAGAEAHHHDDSHGEQTGVEHLVDKRHVNGEKLEGQCDRNRQYYAGDGAFVGGLLPEQTQKEQRENTRTYQAGVLLDILEHLPHASEQRGNQTGDDKEESG